MTRNQKTGLVAGIIFLVYLAVIIGVAFLLPFSGSRLIIFCVVLGLVGLIATIIAVMYKQKAIDANAPPDAKTVDTGNLDALVRSAENGLKKAPGGAKTLGALPLVYLLGDENAGKTEIVLKSGLDAELLAGQVNRDGLVPPTLLANIWYTASAAIVEAGGPLLRQTGLWYRLIGLTAPSKLGAAFSKGALQPTRAAVVCVSLERVVATNSTEQVRALGQAIAEQLRLLAKTLGITLPVYVLFTKLDTIPSFSDYVARLTDDEVRDPLGALLGQLDAGAGLYAERATTQIAQRFDEICYSLSEYRLEVLSRGNAPDKLARAYEFPRELRKLRGNIVDLLIEAGRPSQLGVNPFLRGFYFTGVRRKLVEDAAAPAFATPASAPVADAAATRVFSFQPLSAPMQAASARGASRSIAQWAFLPQLFTRVFLADRGALETSRASTRVNVVKRALIGSVAALIFFYLVALTVSYFKNATLEDRLRAAAVVPMPTTLRGEPASTEALQHLEELRLVFVQIAGYQKNGPPLSHRWGLYGGDPLFQKACAAYGSHFGLLLLQPTQANILNHLTSLPARRLPTDDYGSTYRPLRAYLISTANAGYSSLDFEPDALEEAWVNNRPIQADATHLSLSSFQTYADNLRGPGSCMAALGGAPQSSAVNQARAYLSQFQGSEQVYVSMKTDADHHFPGLRFDDKYPSARSYVTDPFLVEGAFTRGGYDFMQNAILHPEKYTSGEEWVLGPQSTPVPDRNALVADLPARYKADFLNAWRTYLKSAHVVRGASFPEAQAKLHQLDGNQSALLQLFQLISQNTSVPNSAFSTPFQAPQTVVPPAGAALPLGTPYIAGLGNLDSAIYSYVNTPGAQNDPSASTPILTAALAAENAVNTMRGTFAPDPEAGLDKSSEDLLRAPIRSVEDLAKSAPGAAAGGGAAGLCAQMAPVLRKFPFNPDAHEDASLTEAASVFAPGQSLIAAYAALGKMVNLQGNIYVPVQGSPVTPTPAFLSFINAAQALSTMLFPPGGSPTLSFTLTQENAAGLPAATLDIDGRKLSTAGAPMPFDWHSTPASSIHMNAGGEGSVSYNGLWSVFHFAYAKHPAPNTLEVLFEANGQPSKTAAGIPLDYKYDLGGPGAQFLNPAFMRTHLRCVAKVAQ